MTDTTATPHVVTVREDGMIREIWLSSEARKFADELLTMPNPEAHALGHMVATTALLVQAIRSVEASRRDTSPSAPILHELACDRALTLAHEAQSSIDGYRVALDALRRQRREENALSTVQWPASVPADGAA